MRAGNARPAENTPKTVRLAKICINHRPAYIRKST